MAVSNNILNRLAGLQGTNFTITDVKVGEEEIIWRVEHQETAEYECDCCGSKLDSFHDSRWIKIKDMPFGNKKCTWHVKRMRILCTCSNSVRVESLPFRSKHHYLTRRFVDYIEQVLCTKMFTVADVARLFSLDYGVVYKIDHEVLFRMWQQCEIPDPIHISVDEKSFKKGHSYVTLVTDVDLKKVIWVSEGNKKESLDQFFRVIGPERCKKIETVSKDLHRPYALSCRDYVPNAIEVADPFHVVKKLNECMDECRKELAVGSKIEPRKRKKIFKLNWVLRYKKENMRDGHLESLGNLAKLNEPLYKAYLHKEAFYDFFNFRPKQVDEAEEFLITWIIEAFKSNLNGLKDFAEYIGRNTDILLNIIKTQRSSAISEGINRKVTVIKSMAYGYRNIQYFMLKIMQRCGVLGSMWKPAT